MSAGDWERGDGAGLPQDDRGEREAALRAAREILEGPYVRVPRSTWLGIIALPRRTRFGWRPQRTRSAAASPSVAPRSQVLHTPSGPWLPHRSQPGPT
jgi:hypothetical protein